MSFTPARFLAMIKRLLPARWRARAAGWPRETSGWLRLLLPERLRQALALPIAAAEQPLAGASTKAGDIRRLNAEDEPLFLQHLLRLDPETRRSRFALTASDSALTRYAAQAFEHGSIVYAFVENGAIRASGEVRAHAAATDAADSAVRRAEAAFCVEPRWRNQGLGTRLMEIALLEAMAMEATHLTVTSAATNGKMQALAKTFGASLRFEHGTANGLLQPAPNQVPSQLLRQAPQPAPQKEPRRSARAAEAQSLPQPQDLTPDQPLDQPPSLPQDGARPQARPDTAPAGRVWQDLSSPRKASGQKRKNPLRKLFSGDFG